MRWLGPDHLQRVRTFLLVVQRLRADRICGLPKDVVHLIVVACNALEVENNQINLGDLGHWDGGRWTCKSLGLAWVHDRRDWAVANCLKDCQDPVIWRWAGIEYATTYLQTSLLGESGTLLHLAARENNMLAVRELMAIWMNPLLYSALGKRAVDLTTNAEIRSALLAYAASPPRREVIEWYGPYLQKRVRAFLLVLMRWRQRKIRTLPKSVIDHIIVHICALEST